MKRNLLTALAVLTALLAVSCTNQLNPASAKTSGDSGYKVTLSFTTDSGSAGVAASARTLVPDFTLSSASSLKLRVFDSDTGVEQTDLAQTIDPTQTYYIVLSLPSLGPWDFTATAYAADGTTILASGIMLSKTFGQSGSDCSIQLVPPQTSGATGTLTYNIYLYDLPVDVSAVSTTLVPLTVNTSGNIVEGTAVDMTGYLSSGSEGSTYAWINIEALPLNSGNYRLRSSFTYNSRTFYVSGIDPVLRICDSAVTTDSAYFYYAEIVPDLTQSFEIATSDAEAEGKTAYVALYDESTYFKMASDGYTELYETPYRVPIGVGLAVLDAEGAGSAQILDSEGNVLTLTADNYYHYRVFVDVGDRYSDTSYDAVSTIEYPEALIATEGDYSSEGYFYKSGAGKFSVDLTEYYSETPVYFAADSATGLGDGSTYENAATLDTIFTNLQGESTTLISLVSDITSIGSFTVPNTAVVHIFSCGDTVRTFKPAGDLTDGSLFNVPDGAQLYLYAVSIDGSNTTTNSNSPAISVEPYGSLVMGSGCSISDMTTSEGNGAAIYVYEGYAAISYTTFTGNTVVYGAGGAIAVNGELDYSATVELGDGVSFFGNEAQNGETGNGGAIYVGPYGTLNMDFEPSLAEQCMIMTGNAAAVEGGGIYVESGGYLYGSYYWLNAVSGGGYVSVLTANTAGISGTEDLAVYGTLSYLDTIAMYVSSTGTGPGLSYDDPAPVSGLYEHGFSDYCLMSDVTLSSPVTIAGRYISLYSYNGAQYRITPASTADSAFDIETNGYLYLTDLAVGYLTPTATTASLIVINYGNCEIGNNVSITGSQSSVKGGGIYVNGGTLSVNGSGTDISNNTGTYGGGVYVGSDGYFNMYAGTIDSNTAASNGGGVCLGDDSGDYGTLYISAGTISNNTAGFYGGGVFYSASSSFNDTSETIGTYSGNSPDNIATIN